MRRETTTEREGGGEGGMTKRRVTLEDGRYLIFYTFDADAAPQRSDTGAERPEPDAKPVAEEEHRV
ncbi:MAG: hypothetical protein ACRD68_17100 [Pyrinomonadaceae bacterium]